MKIHDVRGHLRGCGVARRWRELEFELRLAPGNFAGSTAINCLASAPQFQPMNTLNALAALLLVDLSSGLVAPALAPRATPARMEAATAVDCWVLECGVSTDESVGSLAEVMRQCAKEGAMLRGLEGALVVESMTELKILAEGPEQRLKSFTKWATGALADTAVDVQLIEGCPVVDSGRYGGSLSPRFSLIAPAGSTDALAEWQRRIVPEEPEMQSCAEEMV